MAKSKSFSDSEKKKTFTDLGSYERSISSISNSFSQQDSILKEIQKKMETTKGTISSLGKILQSNNDLTVSQKDAITESVAEYKQYQVAISKARIEQKKGNITQSEYNELIIKGKESYDDFVKSISASGKSAKAIIPILQSMGKEMESFAEAAKRSQKMIDGVNIALDQIGGSGVEGMRELTDVMKSATNGGKGLTTALFALGAAAGALAYNYGLVGDKVGMVAGFDKKIAEISGNIAIANLEIERGGFGGRNFVAEKAAAEFASSIKQSAASFRAAAKTALFGKGLGSVGYGAAQLEMAGISSETIASGMQAAANETGRMPTAKIGADMAIMAARTGQSAEGIASINDAFMRMDGVSEKTALNLQEGVRAMADKAGVNLGGVMEEMAGASKEMLGYQIKSGSALARQVVFAKSMGVSFNEIAKAGQSMVLNYKDSIKAEMSLSAMLGKNVDLSEVRAKFASGDTEGAMKSLKAQGLNPAEMDMFQQQQLQSALGGMDLTSLQKIATRTGRGGGALTAGTAGGGNQQFLATTQAAQATLNAENASISSDTAIQLAEIDKQFEMAKQDAIINNTGGLNKLNVQLQQQQGLKTATESATTAMYGLIGALIASGIGSLFKGKIGNPFSKGGPGMTPSTSPTGRLRGPDGRFISNKIPAASVADDVVNAGSKSSKLLKILPKMGKFAKGLGVVGTVLGAGFDYKNRKDEGQTNTQAIAGTGGGVGGALAGAAVGAALGSVVPVVGTAIGGIIGGALGAWGGGSLADLITGVGKKAEVKGQQKAQAKQTAKIQENIKPAQTASVGGTSVATKVTQASQNLMQERLKYMSGNLERVVDRTNRTMINTAATTKELTTLNTNTKAIMNLTKTIEALTVATYQGSRDVSVKIDGKKVAYSYNKYSENTQIVNPGNSTTKK
jgi:hypothetical protein